jgi:hypothetical protein
VQSEADQGAFGSVTSWTRLYLLNSIKETSMNTKVLCWLSVGFLAATTLVAILVVPDVAHPADPPARARSDFSPYVTKDGSISLPSDYREKFMHLGTWAVAPKPNQPVTELHNVYTRVEDVQAYRQNGKFADGAVLVKEVTHVGSDKLTTGQSSWSTNMKIWFVMIKDSKGRFHGNDLWGDGWGWALFEAKDPKKNVATDYKTDCRPCHVPAKQHDWVYDWGYSILAKPIPPR